MLMAWIGHATVRACVYETGACVTINDLEQSFWSNTTA